ncbi:MAG: hypothetical protein MAG795_01136 [Candidatus Woesearchaeota archaeon]|nr:hypothetical protein [Candidatus Woesearchaeota archaeon]
MEITKDTNIGELLTKHPQAAIAMMKHGFHCVGCHMAHFETIKQGAAAHGMNDEKLDNMIKEIKKTVEENEQ